jgi:hypothetical protein
MKKVGEYLMKLIGIIVIIVAIMMAFDTMRIINAHDSSRTQKTLQKKEIVEQVNKEAEKIFDTLFTNGRSPIFLYEQDLKPYPTIASLGEFVAIVPVTKDYPAHIRVSYGLHWDTKHVLIFDPRKKTEFSTKKRLIEMAPNIFILDNKHK